MKSINKKIQDQIKELHRFERSLEVENYLTSIGGSLIGEGCYRQAWKLGNLVIKFSIGGRRLDYCLEDNLSEINCYRKSPRIIKKMFAKVYLDLSCKEGKFVVMDYAPNDIHSNIREYDARRAIVEKFESKAKRICKNYRMPVPSCILDDSHNGNFRRTASGKLVMIDLQCFGDY